jgi:hypothetical protein
VEYRARSPTPGSLANGITWNVGFPKTRPVEVRQQLYVEIGYDIDYGMRWLQAMIDTAQNSQILLVNHIRSMLTQSLSAWIF